MARRTDIIEALVGHLGTNTDVHANNVHRTYKYMHDLNDFPAITFIPNREDRDHFGAWSSARHFSYPTPLLRV